jgi:hypothetical protein
MTHTRGVLQKTDWLLVFGFTTTCEKVQVLNTLGQGPHFYEEIELLSPNV